MILVNGAPQPVVSAYDRGLAYGDGVFRTLSVRKAAPAHWARHYAKLAADCLKIGIPTPDENVLTAEVATIAQQERDCAIKIIITRGPSGRGYKPPAVPQPTRIVASYPRPDYPRNYREHGVRVHLCALRLSDQIALAGVKHLNRLENVMARAEWNEGDYAEGLLCDRGNNIVCGTMSNVFIVENARLVTPDLTRCGVAGVTRDRVIAAARRYGMPYAIEPVPLARALESDEAFLVNSLIGLWPVQYLAGKAWEPGPVTASVEHWLDET